MDNRSKVLLSVLLIVLSACNPPAHPEQAPTLTATVFIPTQGLAPTAGRITPKPTAADTAFPDQPEYTCADVTRLPLDSPEAQQIREEFVTSYRSQQPEDYMGLAVLHRIDQLGDWALIQGSVSGEGKDVLVVYHTQTGYQLVERFIVSVPLASFEEPKQVIPRYFLEKLPGAPQVLFTCLDQSWLLDSGSGAAPGSTHQLAYIGTDNNTTSGVTQLYTIQSDASDRNLLFTELMLVLDLASSPFGEQILFWGCPGSLAGDCLPQENSDIWVISWDGGSLLNLTEQSSEDERSPDWSPDGQQIVFESWRTGRAEIYIMNADGSGTRQLTDGPGYNREPKWSPDGKWIAYHCTAADGSPAETYICVISPQGEPAGEPLLGSMPVWSPLNAQGEARIAFLCIIENRADLCVAPPDGSGVLNLTDSPYDDHSPAWSPNGEWLAYVSNRDGDIDIYKICTNCVGEPRQIRLTDELRETNWPVWSPDGRRVAYTEGMDSMNLMVVNADGSDAVYVASGIWLRPVWRP